jgi:hypothetical protein
MNGMFGMGMKSLRVFLLIPFAFTLSACGTKYSATKYSPMSTHTGTGYWQRQIDSTLWEVRFIANNATEMERVNRYVLYHSAELTTGHGFDYFRVLDNSNDSSGASFSELPFYSRMNGPQPENLKLPPDKFYAATHSAGMIVRMFQGRCPANDSNAYNAKSMLAVMGPTVNK